MLRFIYVPWRYYFFLHSTKYFRCNVAVFDMDSEEVVYFISTKLAALAWETAVTKLSVGVVYDRADRFYAEE